MSTWQVDILNGGPKESVRTIHLNSSVNDPNCFLIADKGRTLKTNLAVCQELKPSSMTITFAVEKDGPLVFSKSQPLEISDGCIHKI